MAFVLEKFLFCLELQIGGIIMAWWGMIISALSIVMIVLGLLTGKGDNNFRHYFPFHLNAGSALLTAIVMIIILLVYFYFSYQLLLGSQSGNSSQMFGYLVIHGIMVILFIIGIFGNASSILGVIIYIYLWFCVYSLYVRSGGTGIC